MSKPSLSSGSLFLALCTLLAGCGSETPAEPADAGAPVECTTPSAERLLPLAVGKSWTYNVTDVATGTTVVKASTVQAFEDVGGSKAGTMAFRVRTEKTDGATVSWQEDHCDGVVRHREQGFDLAGTQQSDEFYMPSKKRVDETAAHLVMGASWTETYIKSEIDLVTGQSTSTPRTETWTVEAVDEMVTVPAGTFNCIKIHKVGEDLGQSDKRYWFAKGVGKVREEGDQIEELVSYVP